VALERRLRGVLEPHSCMKELVGQLSSLVSCCSNVVDFKCSDCQVVTFGSVVFTHLV